MLKGIFNNNLANSQLSQTSAMDKTGLFEKKNPYMKADANCLVDSLDISNDAVNLYQKEQDITNFTKLALSDPSDLSHNSKVADLLNSSVIAEEDNSAIIDSLFNNSYFMEDLFG